MALSQLQKNQIALLKDNPDKFLEQIKNKTIDLESFKHESFQDKKGLLHFLIECYDENPEVYYPIVKEVLSSSSLSLMDTHNPNGVPILNHFISLNHRLLYPYGDNTDEIEKLNRLIEINPLDLSPSSYSQVMHIFSMNEDKEKFFNLFSFHKNIYKNEFWEIILEKFIIENNLENIKKLVDNGDNVSTEILKLQATRLKRQASVNTYEHSNLLSLAVVNSVDIAHYFLDNLNFNLEGKVAPDKEDKFNIYRSTVPAYSRGDNKNLYLSYHVLDETIEKNQPELFSKVLNKLQSRQISNLFHIEKLEVPKIRQNYYTSNYAPYKEKVCTLEKIIQNENKTFYSTFVSQLPEVIVNSNSAEDKIKLLNFLLEHKNISMKEKLEFSQLIIPSIPAPPEKKSDDYSYQKPESLLRDFLKFIKNSYISPYDLNKTTIESEFTYQSILTEEETELAGKIFHLAIHAQSPAFKNYEFLNTTLFNDTHLFNCFLVAGWNINKDYESNKIINPFYNYYHLPDYRGYDGKLKSYSQIDRKNINKNFNTMKLLGKDNIYLPLAENINLLTYCLTALDPYVFDNLTDKEILKLSQIDVEFPLMNLIALPSEHSSDKAIVEKQKKVYQNMTQRMFDLGFNFFNEGNPHMNSENKNDDFYNLLTYGTPELISQVINREGVDIFKLSQDIKFWEHITRPDVMILMKKFNADFDSIKTTQGIAFIDDSQIFNNYLKNGGTIIMKDENKDNLLHFLVKNELFEKATILLNFYPELTQQVNKQQKIALSYMIVNFDKFCRDYKKSPYGDVEKKFTQQKLFFDKYMEIGEFNQNKKSRAFLIEQLSKYTHINTYYPDLKEKMSQDILISILEEKSSSSTFKRKI